MRHHPHVSLRHIEASVQAGGVFRIKILAIYYSTAYKYIVQNEQDKDVFVHYSGFLYFILFFRHLEVSIRIGIPLGTTKSCVSGFDFHKLRHNEAFRTNKDLVHHPSIHLYIIITAQQAIVQTLIMPLSDGAQVVKRIYKPVLTFLPHFNPYIQSIKHIEKY